MVFTPRSVVVTTCVKPPAGSMYSTWARAEPGASQTTRPTRATATGKQKLRLMGVLLRALTSYDGCCTAMLPRPATIARGWALARAAVLLVRSDAPYGRRR